MMQPHCSTVGETVVGGSDGEGVCWEQLGPWHGLCGTPCSMGSCCSCCRDVAGIMAADDAGVLRPLPRRSSAPRAALGARYNSSHRATNESLLSERTAATWIC